MANDLIITDQRIVFLCMTSETEKEPLWPMQTRSSGHGLWKLINAALDWDRETYLSRTTRINFKTKPGDMPIDVINARRNEIELRTALQRVICLGSVVSRLFNAPDELMTWDGNKAVIPHPAGINRWYNMDENRAAVVDFLREALK